MRTAGRRDGEAPAPAGMRPGGPLPGEKGCRSGSRRSGRLQDCIPRTASDARATGDQGIDACVLQRPHPGSILLPTLTPPFVLMPTLYSLQILFAIMKLTKQKEDQENVGEGRTEGWVLLSAARATAYQPHAATHQPYTSHTPTAHQPHASHTPATHHLHTSHTPPSRQPLSNCTPASLLHTQERRSHALNPARAPGPRGWRGCSEPG